MRKTGLFVLTLAMGITLAGCRGAGVDQPLGGQTTPPAVTTTVPGTTAAPTLPNQTVSGELPVAATGRLRISYTGNRSEVRYITDPAQLPDYPELEAYDSAYFQEHALVLVTETVASGSVRVDIGTITVENGVAVVTLTHEMQGDAGTGDMATWLIWAEVEPGLTCRWTVTNPSSLPDSSTAER